MTQGYSPIYQRNSKARWSCRWIALVSCVAFEGLLLGFALGPGLSSALAAGPPEFVAGTSVTRLTQTTAAGFNVHINSVGSETKWQFEYSEHIAGSWIPVPGGSGVIVSGGQEIKEVGEITGLKPETVYYYRVKATNASGTSYDPVLSEAPAEFETVTTHPRSACCRVSRLVGTSAHVQGEVIPDNFETNWRIEYATSVKMLEEDAGSVAAEGTIPAVEADEAFHNVEGELTGLKPETVYYVSVFAENVNGGVVGKREFYKVETGGPPRVLTFADHSVQGGELRALGSVVQHGFDTHVHVEYVAQEQFAESGWAGAQSTPEVDVGAGEFSGSISGYPTEILGEDLPGLAAGKSYRYRLVGSNGAFGGSVVDGGEQTLTVPGGGGGSGGEGACPNASLRVGLAAGLADCRAYELVTPADKEGAMDIDTYGAVTDVASIGEDGDHLLFEAPFTQWGSDTDAKATTYAFSRSPAGWEMGTLTPQPTAAQNTYFPEVFSANLGQVGVAVDWESDAASESPNIEFEAGPAGGPYVTAAVVPRADHSLWVAGSTDGSKLILQSTDRTLAGRATGTSSNNDLYEFAGGELRQVNVLSSGAKIGVCGAKIVKGFEGYQETEVQVHAESTSPNAVSGDGSRVFFYAGAPGKCPTETELDSGIGPNVNLYVRVNGGEEAAETVDIGAYKFLAANTQGTELLLEAVSGSTHEFVRYDTGTKEAKTLFTTTESIERPIVAVDSTGVSAFYFRSKEQLTADAPPISETETPGGEGSAAENVYRYDLGSSALEFIAQAGAAGQNGGGYSVSPNGEDYYFASTDVGGVPRGEEGSSSVEVYRFDAEEGVVQCMSCASSFDPEPKLGASFLYGRSVNGDGVPNMSIASENGDYVFFESTAALVPGDVDGEIPPDDAVVRGNEHIEFVRSPSSDVYEWRRVGVDGCGLVGGCVSLVSGGTGGYKTELLGTTPSGDDVFFATHEALVGQDTDRAGDIYDARIDGGFPPPAGPPVECEGDSCATPFAAPSDLTPATATFQGAGDVSSEAGASAQSKAKGKKKRKAKRKAKARTKMGAMGKGRGKNVGKSAHGKGR